ncbi:MAG: hypothetical protein PHN74_00400 [Candidatus Pacebacteria bacterium]|nr:hypothetical protein [Candidatus Paceibacterota bacterium]
MTIIEPNKHKYNPSSGFILVAGFIVLSAFLSINFYNKNVNLRHLITSNTKNLQEMQVSNAEFKDKLYSVLAPENIKSLAQSLNLVQEKRPEYINSGLEPLARN